MGSNGTAGYSAPGHPFSVYGMAGVTTLPFCLQHYKFMGHSQVAASGGETGWASFRCAPAAAPQVGGHSQLGRVELSLHSESCLSDLITAGCPLGIQSPLSAGWCRQGRQPRGILPSQASPWRVGRAKCSGNTFFPYSRTQGAKQTAQKGVTGE